MKISLSTPLHSLIVSSSLIVECALIRIQSFSIDHFSTISLSVLAIISSPRSRLLRVKEKRNFCIGFYYLQTDQRGNINIRYVYTQQHKVSLTQALFLIFFVVAVAVNAPYTKRRIKQIFLFFIFYAPLAIAKFPRRRLKSLHSNMCCISDLMMPCNRSLIPCSIAKIL